MAIDIDQSFYKTGTATVANGSTAVTGQGTLWTQTCRAGDLFGTHVGDGTRILSIESNTSLTLAYPWQGASQTASAYEIQFTPYDVGYQAAVRKLLTTLASGNIESFGELVGFEDGVPVFTGVGTLELVNKSEFVTPDPNGNLAELSGLANVDNLAELSGLANVDNLAELSGLANVDNLAELAALAKQNNQFIVMGADGSMTLRPMSDFLSLIGDQNPTNILHEQALKNLGIIHPFSDRILTSLIPHMNAGDDSTFARLTCSPTGEVGILGEVRLTTSGNFGYYFENNERLYVSTSGTARVNGREIVASGSNANGEFVRYYDGTQMCWARVNIVATPDVPTEYAVTYPAPFSSTPTVSVIANTTATTYKRTTFSSANSSSFNIVAWRENSVSTGHDWIAIGRWY